MTVTKMFVFIRLHTDNVITKMYIIHKADIMEEQRRPVMTKARHVEGILKCHE